MIRFCRDVNYLEFRDGNSVVVNCYRNSQLTVNKNYQILYNSSKYTRAICPTKNQNLILMSCIILYLFIYLFI